MPPGPGWGTTGREVRGKSVEEQDSGEEEKHFHIFMNGAKLIHNGTVRKYDDDATVRYTS